MKTFILLSISCLLVFFSSFAVATDYSCPTKFTPLNQCYTDPNHPENNRFTSFTGTDDAGGTVWHTSSLQGYDAPCGLTSAEVNGGKMFDSNTSTTVPAASFTLGYVFPSTTTCPNGATPANVPFNLYCYAHITTQAPQAGGSFDLTLNPPGDNLTGSYCTPCTASGGAPSNGKIGCPNCKVSCQ